MQDTDLVSAVIIRATGALGFRTIFNIGLNSLCLLAMVVSLFAVGIGTLVVAIATTIALLLAIGFHIHQISTPSGHSLASAQ